MKNILQKTRIKLMKHYYRFVWGGSFDRLMKMLHWPFAKRRRIVGYILLMLVSGVYTFYSLGIYQASAKSFELSSQYIMDGYRDFNQIQTLGDNKSFTLQRGDIGTWDGDNGLGMAPTRIYEDMIMAYGPNDTLYLLTGTSGCTFWRYSMELRIWEELTAIPIGCGVGANITYDGKSGIYYLPGGSTTAFFRYEIATDSWTTLADVPASVGRGASSTYVEAGLNSALYLIRGNSSASFLQYNVQNNSWSSRASFPTSSSVDQGISIVWDNATSIYGVSQYRGEFKRYNISTNSWQNLATAPGSNNQRYTLLWISGKLYTTYLQINNERSYVAQYEIATNSWTMKAQPPVGSVRDFYIQAATDGESIFTMMGYWEHQRLFRYNTVTNTWYESAGSMLPSVQENSYSIRKPMFDGAQTAYYIGGYSDSGADRVWKKDLSTGEVTQIGAQFGTNNGFTGAYSNNALYTLAIGSGVSFGKFDLATNNWVELPNAPYGTSWGSDVIDGDNGWLYVTFGGRSNFYRYNEASGWQSLASMPRSIGSGGQMARIGGSIYVLSGAQSATLLRYNISTNTWSTMQETPTGSVDHGSFLTSDGSRYLYAALAPRVEGLSQRFYRYDTTVNTWTRIADMPQPTQVGASAFYQPNTGKVWVLQGVHDQRLWSWSPSNSSYITSGSWYSGALDMEQVQTWQSLNITSSGSGIVTTYSRTSTNGNLWTDWQQVSGTTINSPPNRYLQLKVTLSGDGTMSPTVNNITLNYTQETTPPTLPSQFMAYGSKGGASLTSGVTYEYQHPYFEWGGASDGSNGSGVAGYYVYFGTDSNADPVADGNYQTTSNYTVTAPMTAGDIYYIRIKVKDRLGNISDAATYFSYRYFYISPPGSVLTSTQMDFSSGINTGVSIDPGGSIGLIRQTAGAWATGPISTLPSYSVGGAAQFADGRLYVLRGNSSTDFWRYNIENGIWEQQASLPSSATHGSSLTWDGGHYIYAMAGGNTAAFYRFNMINNIWESLPNLPALANSGSIMAYIGNDQIAIVTSGVQEMNVYNTEARTYTLKSSPPLNISTNRGSGMWFDGADTLYTTFGPCDEWSPIRRTLVAYTISSDSWQVLPSSPMQFYTVNSILTGDGRGKLYIFGNDYYFGLSMKNTALSYDIASQSWSVIPNSNANVIGGTTAYDGKRYIYIIPSLGEGRKLVRYDTIDQRFDPVESPVIPSWQRLAWDSQSSWIWQAGTSTTAVFDGADSVYAIGADQSTFNRFIKLSVSTGKTSYLAPLPAVGTGGTLEFSNGTLYYLRAASTNLFYRYNQSLDNWEQLTSLPEAAYQPGSRSLIGLNNGSLLAFAGNNNRLYKYTPGSDGGSWQALATAPATILNGAATYDGSNNVYVLAGRGTNLFYRYTISTNSWTTLTALPRTANSGATLVFRQGIIYATAGSSSTASYQYNVSSNSWQEGPELPEPFRQGADMIYINNDYALAFAGDNSSDIWRFNYPGTTQAYSGYAAHISQPINVDGLFDYAGIKANIEMPDNTKIEFWTRSSSDGAAWDDWVMSDQVKRLKNSLSVRVASKPQAFTQIQVKLYSYDNVSTPIVFDYALDYYYDVTPPTNPTVLHAYSDNGKTTQVEDNVWYNHSRPLFDWPDPGQAGGATDGPLGSNLKGYYVYIGTDPTAIPRTAGIFVEGTEYSPYLTVSATYYVRLQAVDMTGNVDPEVFAPFRYKFDNTPPTIPSLITVTPSGFTGNNNYTFEWPNSFDNESGVKEYCYHTGALTGPFAIENCQPETSLENISAAYQSGTNAFYLRSRDNAGNFSTGYAQVSYYYSTDPPTPVTNLRAVPPSSEANLFAFTWDLPSMFSGDPDRLQYCFSINSLPTPTNTTCVQDRFIAAFKAATSRGTNTIYMVAKDEAGNANWNNYAMSNFIANTISPGIPLNLTATDTSDSSTDRWSITLTWDPPVFSGNGVTSYIIERSEDNHTFVEIGRVSNRAYVDLTVMPDKIYYYRIKAADNVDNQGGASGVVTISAKGSFAVPPKIVSPPRVSPGFDQATIEWVTDRPATSFIYYGMNPAQTTQSKGTLDLTTEHRVTITGLLPSTSYYYRVQSFDDHRTYDLAAAMSQLYTFKSTETARIFGVQSSDATLNSALISWETSVPTTTRIEYGPTTKYGFIQDSPVGATSNHIVKLIDLPSGSLIHYRIIATAGYGSVVRSDDYTLRTIARPVVTNLRFQPVDAGNTVAVKVTWQTNVPTTSEITYRALGSKDEYADTALKTDHSVTLTNLASSTDYDFEIRGRDQYGYIASASSQRWRSGIDTKEPTISDFTISSLSTLSTGSRKAQLIITWTTDEPTTSQIIYDKASAKNLNQKTPLNTEPTTNHVVVISGLDLAQVYKVQPISRDINGNTAHGVELVVVTPDIDESPLDIILNSLQRIFRL